MALLLQYPALPLGILIIAAAWTLLSKYLKRADGSTAVALEQVQARVQALEKKQVEHSNKLTDLALRGLK